MAAGAALTYLGYPEVGDALRELSLALAAVGIGHKISKAAAK